MDRLSERGLKEIKKWSEASEDWRCNGLRSWKASVEVAKSLNVVWSKNEKKNAVGLLFGIFYNI